MTFRRLKMSFYFTLSLFLIGSSFHIEKCSVCYYGSWAVYRPGRGKFPVEEIDPFLCSHIIYGFAGLSYENKIRPKLGQRCLSQVNKNLKTLIAIGGWNEGSTKYSQMAANPESRKVFVQSVLDFLERYDFDGLDMDWEYPGSRGGKHEDKQNFVALLRELKAAFKPRNYILSAAVAAGKHFMDPAYDIPEISKHLDMINVMCYDYHGSWEKTSGHHAPLFARPDRPEDYQLNVNFSINYWISKGAPREKLILGMGTYGRAFTLRRAEDHGIGDSAPQKGQAGPYTREGGSLGYNEICEMQTKHPDMSTVWDPYYLAPYSFWGRQWVGYDNVESIAIKSQYAKAMGLGGGMIWSIETDDFGGYCNQGRYPLLRAIRKVFDDPKKAFMPKPDQQSKQPHETTKPPSTPSFPPQQTTKFPTQPSKPSSKPSYPPKQTTKFPPQTTKPSKNPNAIEENPSSKDSDILIMKESSQSFTCTGSGLFRNPESCTKFIRCVETDIEDQFQLFFYECPDKTVFNSKTQLCDWVENVPDCLDSVPKYYFRGINFQNKGVVAIVNKGIGVFNDDEDGEDETQ
ncbi:Sar s 15 allergen (chitinase-like protein) [Sarcoptes scabiei]|uniref:chitinase n=1 Tax=Sarcoptes scabiei TaxID=52283 RepID=A0A132AA67_SARSC|nr:Sar s 15 allergen (chitinase-like protein) [Sarcoptes scabiei]